MTLAQFISKANRSFFRLFQVENAPDGVVVGIGDLIYLALQCLHVGRMEYVVDLEPEEILVIGNSQPFARFGEGIQQLPLNGTMGVGDGGVVEIATNQQVVGVDRLDLLGDGLCRLGTHLESGTQFLCKGSLEVVESFGTQALDKG